MNDYQIPDEKIRRIMKCLVDHNTALSSDTIKNILRQLPVKVLRKCNAYEVAELVESVAEIRALPVPPPTPVLEFATSEL